MEKVIINTSDFVKRLEKFNSIGYSNNKGLTRLAFSENDIKARSNLIKECRDLDLEVDIDGAGNIWAKKVGTNPDLPSIIMGSHIDTVPEGGCYDGILGVLAGLEIIRMLKENNIKHQRSIELICFSAEESSRFNISTVGSKLLADKIDANELKNYSDSDNLCLYDEMMEGGLNPHEIKNAQERLKNAACFLELHIEQGPILDKNSVEIGIVESIAAPTRMKIKIIGEEAHSGACPIDLRKDALVASAEIICSIENVGREESKEKTITTVGKCEVLNSAINIVPGVVELFVDVRGIDMDSINRAVKKIKDVTYKVSSNRVMKYDIEMLSSEKPVGLNENLMDVVKFICQKEGKNFMKMSSGGGHDTMNIASIIPSALIFIPCINGISHNRHEKVKLNDIENGFNILYKTVLFLSNKFSEYF